MECATTEAHLAVKSPDKPVAVLGKIGLELKPSLVQPKGVAWFLTKQWWVGCFWAPCVHNSVHVA